MMCIQKVFGLRGLNHQIIEKILDVTLVKYGHVKVGQYSAQAEFAISIFFGIIVCVLSMTCTLPSLVSKENQSGNNAKSKYGEEGEQQGIAPRIRTIPECM